MNLGKSISLIMSKYKNKYQSQKISNRWLRQLTVFCYLLFYLLCTSSTFSESLNSEIHNLVRSGRWSEIIGYFSRRNASSPTQRYALARAHEEEKSLLSKPNQANVNLVITEYIKAVGLNCDTNLLHCVQNSRTKGRSVVANLAILRSSELAKKIGNIELQAGILLLADTSRDNPLSRRLVANGLIALVNLNRFSDALTFIEQTKNITGSATNHARGKVYAGANRNSDAIQSYLMAATETDASWLIKAIYQDLTKVAPDYPNTTGLTEWQRRAAVHFYDRFNLAQIGFSPNQLIETTTAETIQDDGKILIRSNQQSEIIKLSERGYTYLSRESDILTEWVKELTRKNDNVTAAQLIQKFSHTKVSNSELWRAYLTLLSAKSTNQDIYFNELLDYLSVHHSDIQIHDRLITFLIGDHPSQIHWAHQKYWEAAAVRLPRQPGSGRFIYWLWRYYSANFEGRAKELQTTFYKYAPGSYYSVPFWQKSNSAEFVTDWQKVFNKDDYSKWLSVYGGNDEALRFISKKDLSRYYNSEAVKLNRELYQSARSIDPEIVEILALGEYSIGMTSFKERYKNLPKLDYLKNLVIAGINSHNRFIEVYYLRSVLRQLQIPEDPFVLPPRLLNALYPRPYRSTVQKYSREYGMHEDMVYGLMRQESMFREIAESRSGALGLMQIMPKTGEWLASKMGIKSYDLTNPVTSIQLGTKFFSDLLRAQDQDFRWASMAYNGGPGNTRKWKRLYYQGDFNYFLEVLPVEETRNYVRKTYENYLHYHAARILYDQGIR